MTIIFDSHDFLSPVVRGLCGDTASSPPEVIAADNTDASTVAATQEGELETVKNNFLIKKLGLSDGPELMEAINSVIETYGRSERNKYRAVVYYMLAKHFGKESVYG